ncbi:MAG TPA: stability determinant [Allosphingosinicella sp.]
MTARQRKRPLSDHALAFAVFALILCSMNALSPLMSEFETLEEAEAHLRWLQAKVAAARADGRPDVEHDEAMARTRAIIQARSGSAE